MHMCVLDMSRMCGDRTVTTHRCAKNTLPAVASGRTTDTRSAVTFKILLVDRVGLEGKLFLCESAWLLCGFSSDMETWSTISRRMRRARCSL
jgi:hypothetical protein